MNGERLTEAKTKKRNLSKLPSPEMGGERLTEAKTKKQHLSKLPSLNEWGAPNGSKNEEAKPI